MDLATIEAEIQKRSMAEAIEKEIAKRSTGETNQPSYLKGLARHAVQGLTLATGDEMEAGVRAMGPESYDEAIKQIRGENEAFAKENPKMAFAANLAGGAAFPMGRVAKGLGAVGSKIPGISAIIKGADALSDTKQGASAVSDVLRRSAGGALKAGGVGGTMGAVAGAGAAEGGLDERLYGGAMGGALGTVVAAPLGAALPLLGGAAHYIRDKSSGIGQAIKNTIGRNPAMANITGEVAEQAPQALDETERFIAKRLSGSSPESVQEAITLMEKGQAQGVPIRIAEATNSKPLARNQRYLANQDDDVSTLIQEKVSKAALDSPERLKSAVSNIVSKSDDLVDTSVKAKSAADKVYKNVTKGVREETDRLYKEALGKFISTKDPEFKKLLNSGIIQDRINALKKFPKYAKAKINNAKLLNEVASDLNEIARNIDTPPKEAKRIGEVGKQLKEFLNNATGGKLGHADQVYKTKIDELNSVRGGTIKLLRKITKEKTTDAGKEIMKQEPATIGKLRQQFEEAGELETWKDIFGTYLKGRVNESGGRDRLLKELGNGKRSSTIIKQRLKSALGDDYEKLDDFIGLEEVSRKAESIIPENSATFGYLKEAGLMEGQRAPGKFEAIMEVVDNLGRSITKPSPELIKSLGKLYTDPEISIRTLKRVAPELIKRQALDNKVSGAINKASQVAPTSILIDQRD